MTRSDEYSPQDLPAQIIRRVFIPPPIAAHSTCAGQVVLSTSHIFMPSKILIPNLTEMNPFVMIWVKYHILLLRMIRWIQFCSLSQITIRHFLSDSRIGILQQFLRKNATTLHMPFLFRILHYYYTYRKYNNTYSNGPFTITWYSDPVIANPPRICQTECKGAYPIRSSKKHTTPTDINENTTAP